MPRTADHADRHRRIAFAVWALIARGGFEAVTLRAVAAEAEMSLGQVQHYVRDKADLIRRACAAMIELAEQTYEGRAREGNSGEDPRARLRELLTHLFARTESSRIGVRVWYAFVGKSVDDPEIARLVNDAKAGTEGEIARLLSASGADPAYARLLLALSDGLAERTLTSAISAADADAEIERCLAVVLPAE